MNYNNFMVALRQKEEKHLFLLTGKEYYYIDKTEKRLLNFILQNEITSANESVLYLNGDTPIGELMGYVEEVPFFSKKNIIIVRNGIFFKESNTNKKEKSKEFEKFLNLLRDIPSTTYVIFTYNGKVDKRKNIYKIIEKYGLVLNSDIVEPWKINEWLREKLLEVNRHFDEEAMEYFLGAVSLMRPVSLSFLDKEIDKLVLYSDKKIFSCNDLKRLMSSVPEISGFALIEAINAKNTQNALKILKRQIKDGVFSGLIISILAKHVRQLLFANILSTYGIRGRALAVHLGEGRELSSFVSEKIGRIAMTFNTKKLTKIFLELADADYYYKTGKAGEEFLEQVVIELSQR